MSWEEYLNLCRTNGQKANIMTFTWLKLIENSLCVFIAVLALVLFAVGTIRGSNDSNGGEYFNSARMCLGVLLGMLVRKSPVRKTQVRKPVSDWQ
jgi:hypothetical protein